MSENAVPETLPLSASPPFVEITVELTRAGRVEVRRERVPVGTPIRVLLRQIGQAAEGCAVLEGETPRPLDTPLRTPCRLVVLPTFSGG